ncbi:MAG: PaaI family thioesterase [Acidimicrobiales bacterium]
MTTSSEQRRAAAASLLRDIGHDVVARDLDDEFLDQAIAVLRPLRDALEERPARERHRPDTLATLSLSLPARDDPHRHLFADSVVSGEANPHGLGAEIWREGESVVSRVALGRAFEGAPGRAHGGVVAALLDETMGLVMGVHDAFGFTARLEVTYREPVPVGAEVTARAWLAHRDGRKSTIRATLTHGETVLVEASALFIAVDPARFLASLRET